MEEKRYVVKMGDLIVVGSNIYNIAGNMLRVITSTGEALEYKIADIDEIIEETITSRDVLDNFLDK